MVYKYETEDHAILAAKEWAKKIAEDNNQEDLDVQVVLSGGEYHIESPPEHFIRSWEKVILYLEVANCSVKERPH